MVTIYQSSTPVKKTTQVIHEEEYGNSVLTSFIGKFIKTRQLHKSALSQEQTTFKVNEVLGSLAHLYERIRNVVDYKGEHVLRRNAIERIIKRLLREYGAKDTNRLAKVLLKELILARYVENNSLPTEVVNKITRIFDKYVLILSDFVKTGSGITLIAATGWLWGIASCEIEEVLDKTNTESYATLMYDWFMRYFKWEDDGVPLRDKETQIYIAIERALAKSDDEIIRYRLLLKIYPKWKEHENVDIKNFVQKFYQIYRSVEEDLHYPGRFILYRIIQKNAAIFEVLQTVIENYNGDLSELFLDEQKFEDLIKLTCKVRYKEIQKRVNRGVVRSITYIFITKVFLAFLMEIPYEFYRFGSLRYLPLTINIIIPPSLMWIIGISIRAPGDENTRYIILRLKSVIYTNKNIVPNIFSLIPVKRNRVLAKIFTYLYLALSVLVFSLVSYILLKFNFTYLGLLIFFAFLSLVLLFGFRLRFTANELKVTSDKENILTHLIDNLTLPFLRAGLFLSRGLSKINFISILLDFLIEAPLKSIIEVVGEWASFIKEKKEEVIEVPE